MSCPEKKKLNARRNEASNASENHEMGFYRGFASGGLMALVSGLPNATSGICALCRGYLGRPGEPLRQILLGGRTHDDFEEGEI
jgi:hypothetical protein